MQRSVGQRMCGAIGQQRDVGRQTSHEEVVRHHAHMLRCIQQSGYDVGLCVGSAGATELAEISVEKRIGAASLSRCFRLGGLPVT
jgi:hypothetical protein